MAYVHARARRFDLHRAWAIRLFALVLGSWILDVEYRAWEDLAGGIGIGSGKRIGIFDYIMLYVFFVPNLLGAEFFIRNKHKRIRLRRDSKWLALSVLMIAGTVLAYAVVSISATHSGKYGQHLLKLFGG